MKRVVAWKISGAAGFSLIELIMIIVVVSVVGAVFVTMFAELPRSLTVNEQVQNAAQLAQACNEHVLARRRDPLIGYAPIATGICAGLPGLAGYTVTDNVNAAFAGAACPSAGNCKLITVTVTRGAATLAQTNLMLVNY